MPPKNHYVVLGVARNASTDRIRAAYRALAKRFHPDVSGRDSGAFQDIHDAYEVLSDPTRRRKYDAQLAAPVTAPAAPVMSEPASPPRRPQAKALRVDLVLSPQEAMFGCSVPVGVPAFGTCPSCGGSGRTFFFICEECGGAGVTEALRTVVVEVPPGVRAGAIFEAPLDAAGLRKLVARVQVQSPGRWPVRE